MRGRDRDAGRERERGEKEGKAGEADGRGEKEGYTKGRQRQSVSPEPRAESGGTNNGPLNYVVQMVSMSGV
jgi:hypothetical protein